MLSLHAEGVLEPSVTRDLEGRACSPHPGSKVGGGLEWSFYQRGEVVVGRNEDIAIEGERLEGVEGGRGVVSVRLDCFCRNHCTPVCNLEVLVGELQDSHAVHAVSILHTTK